MKKTSLVVAGIAGLIILLLFLLPVRKQHKETVIVNCPQEAVTRLMIHTGHWKKWWPGDVISDSSYRFNGKQYNIKTMLLNGFYAVDEAEQNAIDIQFVPASGNRTQFHISTTHLFGFNPIMRLIKGIQFRSGNTAGLLAKHLGQFFDSPEKVYGFPIVKDKVPFLNWVSASRTFDYFPDTKDIYEVIDSIGAYVAAQQRQVTGPPILHIQSGDSLKYNLMTALPVDQPFAASAPFSLKRMVPGFLMTSDVQGGMETVMAAEAAMEHYVRDYKKQSPAIPFQTLITDRRTEPDTAKWTTRICYPVFN